MHDNLGNYLGAHRVPYLSETELRHGALQIAKALKSIHEVGFSHNDVQPRHFLIRPPKKMGSPVHCNVKLAGLSYATLLTSSPSEPDPKHVAPQDHSALFKSPELIAKGETSAAADVWALGVSMFYLACGKMPFKNTLEVAVSPVPWHFFKYRPSS